MMKPQYESWKDVPDEDIEKFFDELGKVLAQFMPVDCDGDEVLNAEWIDRREFRNHWYPPIPYDTEGEFEAVVKHVYIATGMLERAMRIRRKGHS